MASLKNVMIYILAKYPFKSEMSNSRLTKLVYLSDWLQAIKTQRQITDIAWYYDNYGPFVKDIQNTASENEDIFKIIDEATIFGGSKKRIELTCCPKDYESKITYEEKATIDKIIDLTKNKNYDDFIKYVYSTYPIVASSQYSNLDLIRLAKEYKSVLDCKAKA